MNTPLKLPSQARLRELFDYVDGQLIWKEKGPGRTQGRRTGWARARGYRQTPVDGHNFYNHRLIWMFVYGEDPGTLLIDHINRDPNDNSISNLRLGDHRLNNQNRDFRKPHYKHYPAGVYKHSGNRQKPYYAQVDKKFIGTFKTIEEAASARNQFIQSINPSD